MRILLISDSPFAQSAYAIQSMQLALALQKAGHDILYYGLTYVGMPQTYQGVKIVGNLSSLEQGKVLPAQHYVRLFNADCVLTIKDPYSLGAAGMGSLKVPWLALAPVDTEPPSIALQQHLLQASHIIACTLSGQAALGKLSLKADYAPLAVDTAFFTPDTEDRARWRETHGITPDTFVALAVGNNNDNPSRKNLDQMVLAWHEWTGRHPERDAVLYLHTDVSGARHGVNLARMLNVLQLDPRYLMLTEPALYDSGGCSPEFVRSLYRGADVLLALGNEGFGMPVVEAAACGLPAITIEFAALKEVICAGWKISPYLRTENSFMQNAANGETYWSPMEAWRFRPSRSVIQNALDVAYETFKNGGMGELAILGRQRAMRYSLEVAMNEYWLPLMAQIEAELKEAVLA